MSFSDEIKQIKEEHSRRVIENAKSEERLVSLNEQRNKIHEQCASIGVKPEDLEAEKIKTANEINAKLAEARALLGIKEAEEDHDNFNAPF